MSKQTHCYRYQTTTLYDSDCGKIQLLLHATPLLADSLNSIGEAVAVSVSKKQWNCGQRTNANQNHYRQRVHGHSSTAHMCCLRWFHSLDVMGSHPSTMSRHTTVNTNIPSHTGPISIPLLVTGGVLLFYYCCQVLCCCLVLAVCTYMLII